MYILMFGWMHVNVFLFAVLWHVSLVLVVILVVVALLALLTTRASGVGVAEDEDGAGGTLYIRLLTFFFIF